eukprot:6677005-Lingulodinium_polyedra.AAC.1
MTDELRARGESFPFAQARACHHVHSEGGTNGSKSFGCAGVVVDWCPNGQSMCASTVMAVQRARYAWATGYCRLDKAQLQYALNTQLP